MSVLASCLALFAACFATLASLELRGLCGLDADLYGEGKTQSLLLEDAQSCRLPAQAGSPRFRGDPRAGPGVLWALVTWQHMASTLAGVRLRTQGAKHHQTADRPILATAPPCGPPAAA